jgi:hypothetical protein
MPNDKHTAAEIAAQLAATRNHINAQLDAIAARLAHGTRPDVSASAALARGVTLGKLAPEIAAPLSALIEGVLRERVASPQEIADATGAPMVKITSELSRARLAHNIGTTSSPRYTWAVGDDAPVDVLAGAVERALRERPMTRAEIRDVTGARDNRVGGAIRNVSRRARLVMLGGEGDRARYFVMPPGRAVAEVRDGAHVGRSERAERER